MKTYTVEVIHELSGAYMNFTYESDEDEDQIHREILADMSVVLYEEQQ